MKNRILITGANGFVGSHLVNFLNTKNYEIHTLGTNPSIYGTFHKINFNEKTKLLNLINTVKPEAIIHLAGIARHKNLSKFYEINVVFAANIIWALKESRLRDCPTILTGSSAEYGLIREGDLPISETCPANPYDHYGLSKFTQTLMGVNEAKNGLPLIMIRPFNIIGPGMPKHLVLQNFVNQIKQIVHQKKLPIIEVGNLSPKRDFIDISDIVESIWQLIHTHSADGEIVNICSGKEISIFELLKTTIDLCKINIEHRTDENRIKPIDVPVHYGSNEKLRKLTGYSPKTNLSESIERILRFEEIIN